MNRPLARLAAIGALCAAVLRASPACPQAADPARAATAQTLYEQATSDMDRKDYVAACKKLEEVIKLVPDALGAKMTLGECYEAQGKSASAWSQYSIVEALAPKQQQAERAKKAADRGAALRPKLATLTIEVPAEVGKTPGLSIARDGVPVGEVQWGTPLPVDVGAHEVVVSAPGRHRWTGRVEVPADGAKVSLKIEALASLPAAEKGTPATTGDAAPERSYVGPITAFGAGAVGLGLGIAFGAVALAKVSDLQKACPQHDCPSSQQGNLDDAKTFSHVSTAGFVLTGVGVAAGFVLILASRPATDKTKKIGVRLGASYAGLEGTF